MPKAARIIVGFVVVAMVLYAADLATRDCRVAPYIYDGCMWLRVRARLGLPPSRLLRMATLESVGITLASVLYLTFKLVFPSRKAKPIPEEPTQIPEPPPRELKQ